MSTRQIVQAGSLVISSRKKPGKRMRKIRRDKRQENILIIYLTNGLGSNKEGVRYKLQEARKISRKILEIREIFFN